MLCLQNVHVQNPFAWAALFKFTWKISKFNKLDINGSVTVAE